VFFPQDGTGASGEVPGARFQLINPNNVIPNAAQPRTEFRPEELASSNTPFVNLACSNPLSSDHSAEREPAPPTNGAMGNGDFAPPKPSVSRRSLQSFATRKTPTCYEMHFSKTLHRANLNALEEASAYQQLLSDFGITRGRARQANWPLTPAGHKHPSPPQTSDQGTATGCRRSSVGGPRPSDSVCDRSRRPGTTRDQDCK